MPPDTVGLAIVIAIGQVGVTIVCELMPLLASQTRFQAPGKVRGGCKPHKSIYPLGSGYREQQHDPATHGGTNDKLRARGNAVQNRKAIVTPSTDTTLFQHTAGISVPKIIEARKLPALIAAPLLQRQRFGPLHIGIKTGTEQYPRLPA
jgi:hypothetical protein